MNCYVPRTIRKQNPQMHFARSYCLLCWDLFTSCCRMPGLINTKQFHAYEIVVFISHISMGTCMYSAFLLSLSQASQQPRMFRRSPYNEAAVLGAAIKERPCIVQLIRFVELVRQRVKLGFLSPFYFTPS
jgi:hypothetical protein